MLKVLYLPLNDADNVQQGMYDAWNEVGVQLHICDFHRVWLRAKNKQAVEQDFLSRVNEVQPQLIHMQLQFTGLISNGILMQAKQICPNVVITNWAGDIRTTAQQEFVSISSAIDYSLISSTGQLDIYNNAGCKNVKYWQIGYDPKFSFPMNRDNFKYDIAFIANNYGHIFPDGPLRDNTAKSLINTFGDRAGIFGSGHAAPVHACNIRETNEIYNNSLCVLSISNFNNVSHYFSDRLLACLASGRPTITWAFPGYESYFVEGSDCFVARNYQDIVNAVEYCKANPSKAKEIGMNGYRKAFKEHTFTSKIIELLHMTKLINLV